MLATLSDTIGQATVQDDSSHVGLSNSDFITSDTL